MRQSPIISVSTNIIFSQGTVEEEVIELARAGDQSAATTDDAQRSPSREQGSETAGVSTSTSLSQRANEAFRLRNRMLRSLHCVSVAKLQEPVISVPA